MERLRLWQLQALQPGLGSGGGDVGVGWQAAVRGWAGIGTSWGIFVSGGESGTGWNFLLPDATPAGSSLIDAHLPGARLQRGGSLETAARVLTQLPFRAVIAGHPAVAETSLIDSVLLALQSRRFALLTLARPTTTADIATQIEQLGAEEQFVRDEHLARPGLERDNHPEAARYVSLLQAAQSRATTALQEGGWHFRTLFAAGTEEDLRHGQALLHAAYTNGESTGPEPVRWQGVSDGPAFTFVRTAEIAAITRPPIKELRGFQVEKFSGGPAAAPQNVAEPIFSTTAPFENNGPTVAIGTIIGDDGKPGDWLEIPTADLCRHTFVAGMTGSGKTITCEHLLLELWREHRIPWLVLEPGLNPSYRRLAGSEIGDDLRVYSIGSRGTDSLPLNPLAALPGVSLAEHIGGLFAVLTSAFELVPPMPEILSLAIDETYRHHGWDTADLVPSTQAPSLRDLITNIGRVVEVSGYSSEIRGNLHAGLVLRLGRLLAGPLASEMSSTRRLDVAGLLAAPTVIELTSLSNGDSQALVLGLLALQLRHHWRLAESSSALTHVTLLEEAHRLLRQVSDTAANASRARAVEDIANMLAELRAKGAGLIIADQTPSALVPSVIANTGTKILHRLDHPADRELAGRAAGLPTGSVDLLGALRPGSAILRSDRRSRPFRLKMPNPAVTYAAVTDRTAAKSATTLGTSSDRNAACPVCGQNKCQGQANGAAQAELLPRMRSLQNVIPEGREAVWAWASHELNANAGERSLQLCFLVALTSAARLPDTTIQEIRRTFERKVAGV
jgi:hypothetical protein